MEDPTTVHPGMALAETDERAWQGKVWQKGKGQRTRAIDAANRLGHEVLVSRQCAANTYNSTSFATAQQYDDFMRKLRAEEPSEQKIFELWVRGRSLWHPTFDIDCAVPGVTEEDVLHVTVPGLQALFLEEYGVAITTEDIVLLKGGGYQKISLHMMIKKFYLEDYADFGRRVARYATRGSAAKKSPELRQPGFRWVDLAIWDNTRAFRTAHQHKHGKSDELVPTRTCAGMQFFDSVGLAPHEHLSSFTCVEDGMELLDEGFTEPPALPPAASSRPLPPLPPLLEREEGEREWEAAAKKQRHWALDCPSGGGGGGGAGRG